VQLLVDFGGDCGYLDSIYVLLWWMCSTISDCLSLDSSYALLGVVVYHWITVLCCYGSTLF
jgi:hypothetical protein